MKSCLYSLFFFAITVPLCLAQQSGASGGQTATSGSQQQAGAGHAAVIPVELSKSIDAKKVKQGDPVEAKTMIDLKTGTGTSIPRGSKVTGHITQAEARANGGSQSQLGIAFDHLVVKGGQDLPLHASIQAVAAPPDMSAGAPDEAPPAAQAPGTSGPAGMGGTSSSPMGGTSGAPGTLPPPASPSTGTNEQRTAQPARSALTLQSTGVIGLRNIQLGPDSTLTSDAKDLKLDAGTEMLLRVQGQ